MQLEGVGNSLNLVIKDIKDKGTKYIVTFNDDTKIKISPLVLADFNLYAGKEVSEEELKASSATTQEQTFRNYMDTTYQQGTPIPGVEDNQPKETSETPKESKSFLKKLSDFLSSLLFFL